MHQAYHGRQQYYNKVSSCTSQRSANMRMACLHADTEQIQNLWQLMKNHFLSFLNQDSQYYQRQHTEYTGKNHQNHSG